MTGKKFPNGNNIANVLFIVALITVTVGALAAIVIFIGSLFTGSEPVTAVETSATTEYEFPEYTLEEDPGVALGTIDIIA